MVGQRRRGRPPGRARQGPPGERYGTPPTGRPQRCSRPGRPGVALTWQRADVRPLLPSRARLAARCRAVAPLRPAERPPRPRSRRSLIEVKALALASLVGYALVGWYLRHVLHFAVGDALARTANAKYMLFARDAHFAALGFVWMPVPTVSQLPFVLVLEPVGLAADAGWLATACWGAATVLVLGRLAADLGLRRWTGLLLVAAYAANPVVAYYAANGMSEGPLFFFLAVTFLGLLRYLRDGDTAALVTTAVGLTGCALDRYEAVPLIAGVGGVLLLADLRRRGRSSAALSTTLAVLPALVAVLLWFAYMKVITGSFSTFLTDAAGSFTAGAPAAPGPAAGTGGRDWWPHTAHWCLAFAPALVLLPLVLLPPVRRAFGGAALLVVALWLPGVTAYLLHVGGSTGDPRYFTSVIVTTTIGVIFLASRVTDRRWAAVLGPLLAAALVAGWVTGTRAQQDRVATGQEQEWRVFDVLRGVVDTADTRGVVATAAASRSLDRLLRPGDRVLLDVRFDFDVELYSRKPDQMIINNDRDYDRIRADPYQPGRRIDYLVFPAPGARGAGFDMAEQVYRADPQQWQRLLLPSTAVELYRRVRYGAAPPVVG